MQKHTQKLLWCEPQPSICIHASRGPRSKYLQEQEYPVLGVQLYSLINSDASRQLASEQYYS